MGKLKKSEQVKSVTLTGLFDKAAEVAEKGGEQYVPAISLSNLQYTTRDEVILPYSHRMDQESLRISLKKYYENFENEADAATKEGIKALLKKKALGPPHQSNLSTVCRLVKEEYRQVAIPNHVSNDLFTLFYNPIKKLEFADRLPENLAKFKLIEKLNNTVLKVITYANPVKTMIIIRAMITHMLITIVFGKYGQDVEDMEEMNDLLKMLGQKQNPVQPCPVNPNGTPGQNGQGQKPAHQSKEELLQKIPKQPRDPNAPKPQPQQQAPVEDVDFEDVTDDPGNHGNQPGQYQSPAVQAQDLVEDFFDDNQPQPSQNQQVQQQNESSQAPATQPGNGQIPQPNLQDPNDEDEDMEGDADPELDNDEFDEDGNPIEDYNIQQNTGQNTSAGTGNTDINSLDEQISKIMTRMYDDPASKRMLDKTIEGARDTIEIIEELMPDDSMKEMWEDLKIDKTELLDRINPGKLDKLEQELVKLKVNAKGLRDKIKHLLDKSISYFAGKEEPFFENILESDNIADLVDWPLLHPALRVIMMEDIMVRNTKKIGKINCYVDVSGSMGSPCGYLDARGHSVTCAALAKAITLAVKRMDLLDRLYTFESAVHPTGNQLIDVLLLDGDGGTELNNVVAHIAEGHQNALVITDACDYVDLYSSKAFFIGVKGARFSSFNKAVLRKYIDSGQVVVFDGVDVLQVDYNGMVIPKGHQRGNYVEEEEEDEYIF
jgi:hypothetical protein